MGLVVGYQLLFISVLKSLLQYLGCAFPASTERHFTQRHCCGTCVAQWNEETGGCQSLSAARAATAAMLCHRCADTVAVGGTHLTSPRVRLAALTLGSAGLIMVDHVHFQYNGLLLGLLLVSYAHMTQVRCCFCRARLSFAGKTGFRNVESIRKCGSLLRPLFAYSKLSRSKLSKSSKYSDRATSQCVFTNLPHLILPMLVYSWKYWNVVKPVYLLAECKVFYAEGSISDDKSWHFMCYQNTRNFLC